MNKEDEFYVGWQARAPGGIGSHVRKTIVFLIASVVGLSVLFGWVQRTIGVAVFEWGTIKTFTGVLQARPYPHLLVSRPGQAGAQSYLVAPFKFGLKPDLLEPLDGKPVTLQGTLIYRGRETMIEARPESIKAVPGPESSFMQPNAIRLGRQTLRGEIVDSKCYLGVMNPGRLTPHRACAVRCISGGIPPILLVRQPTGPPICFLLVSREGQPVNKQVLDMVAEPVEITGEVVRQGELNILQADPESYRRVGK